MYGATALFFVGVLPVYVSIYAYADTQARYASVNFHLYRVFRFLNMNSEEGGGLKINGKEAEMNPSLALRDGKIAFDNLCIFKIIQLSDFGLGKDGNAYAALLQSAATFTLYSYISKKGSSCKLKNYVIMNAKHEHIKYGAKVVSVVNLIAAAKILFILFLERLNENQR